MSRLSATIKNNTETKDSKQHDMTMHMLISTNTTCFKQGKFTWPKQHIQRLKNSKIRNQY